MCFLRTNETFENFGLWDQHLSLRWEKTNIGAFGGDTNGKIIFGESAGSDRLFVQVIQTCFREQLLKALESTVAEGS